MSLAVLFHFLRAQHVSDINIYPSSGACDYSVELPHWSYCSWFDECWSFGVVGVVSVLQAEACNTDTVDILTHIRKLYFGLFHVSDGDYVTSLDCVGRRTYCHSSYLYSD